MSLISRQLLVATTATFCLAVLARQVQALGEENFGPVGKDIGRSADWPRGVEDVLRHPARVYGKWVNGNEHVYFDADIEKMNQLLDLYSKVDLQVHHVTLLPGRPTARSFQGLAIEHNVEFELASGIYLHFIREKVSTGLYSTLPRLTLFIDDTLMKQLDELQVPVNIQLHAALFPVEDILRHVSSGDQSLRYRAVSLLDQVATPDQRVLDALQNATKDESQSVQKLAVELLAKVESKRSDPDQQALGRYLDEFLRNHPQRVLTPTPEEMLKIIQQQDAKYRQGCTIRGTTVEPTISGRTKLVAWTVSMDPGRMVIQRTAVEDEQHPPSEDLLENTIFAGPDLMGTIHRSRLWVDGKLIDTTPHGTFEPVGSTYDLLIGRVVWPLGRGFTTRVNEVTAVARQPDGLLQVAAHHNDGNLKMRWELTLDPNHGYLVRAAKAFRGDDQTPMYVLENLGIQSDHDQCVAHTARWSEGATQAPVSIAVTSIVAQADTQLLRDTEKRLREMK